MSNRGNVTPVTTGTGPQVAGDAGDRSMGERILEAAVQVIRERGVTGATTKEIARGAGVSEGSIYNHFESKTALFGAAFGAVTGGMRAAMTELSGKVGKATVEENLAELTAAAVRFYAELLPMTGPVLANRDVLDWLRASGRSQGPLRGHTGLIRYLEAEQHTGRLARDADPAFIAVSLLGACQQHAFLTLLAGSEALADGARLPSDVDAYARQLVRTLLAHQLGSEASQ